MADAAYREPGTPTVVVAESEVREAPLAAEQMQADVAAHVEVTVDVDVVWFDGVLEQSSCPDRDVERGTSMRAVMPGFGPARLRPA
ncbi:hypothetical protein ABFT23_04740 [Nocardioides sp. C4-1]|uniref:hypothetical protein n=1 Tax=Nocardioides sp. C4-1 TaxID=3151851 RepID=UPI00326753C6